MQDAAKARDKEGVKAYTGILQEHSYIGQKAQEPGKAIDEAATNAANFLQSIFKF